MNTLEYYHIHYIHQYNMMIKEQNQQEKSLIRTNSVFIVSTRKRTIPQPPTTLPNSPPPMPPVTSDLYATPTTLHIHSGKYLISYDFTFYNIPLCNN